MAALTESHGTSVRSASDTLLPVGCASAPLRLWGADALVFYRLDGIEHARRRAVGAQPLDTFRPLETLATFPVGIPVPQAALKPAVCARVRRLPRGAAVCTQDEVTRLAVPPLRVELIVVRAPGRRSGLELASQFAPFARRAMLLERRPPRFEELLLEADLYGIGVLVGDDGQLEVAVEPAAYRPRAFTTAAWRFAEEIYCKVTEVESQADAVTPRPTGSVAGTV